jgi:hypothetical protein
MRVSCWSWAESSIFAAASSSITKAVPGEPVDTRAGDTYSKTGYRDRLLTTKTLKLYPLRGYWAVWRISGAAALTRLRWPGCWAGTRNRCASRPEREAAQHTYHARLDEARYPRTRPGRTLE